MITNHEEYSERELLWCYILLIEEDAEPPTAKDGDWNHRSKRVKEALKRYKNGREPARNRV